MQLMQMKYLLMGGFKRQVLRNLIIFISGKVDSEFFQIRSKFSRKVFKNHNIDKIST